MILLPNLPPPFVWEPTEKKYVFAAIFDDENIDVKDSKIINKDKIIWAWHSGLGSGKEGSVSFYDGRKVLNGEVTNELPDKLKSKNYYIFGVWAWNNDGTQILYSSEVIYFYIE